MAPPVWPLILTGVAFLFLLSNVRIPDAVQRNVKCFLGTQCDVADSEFSFPSMLEPTLTDHPIAAGAAAIFLDGDAWRATLIEGGPEFLAAKGAIPAVVPGDIITDLQNAGVVGDPYWNVTWRDPRFVAAWNTGLWTYTRLFPTTKAMIDASETLLVFDGIRMGATIMLNGKDLGNATDQFLRYEFSVGALLVRESGRNNVLTLTFRKHIQCGGRYTYSSQIDWAPNMVTFDWTQHDVDAQKITGRETFGFGIWKSVYLVPIESAAILQFAPHTFYAGGHPTSMLSDGDHAGFEVRAKVVIWAPQSASGDLHLSVLNVASEHRHVTLVAGLNNFNITIPANATRSVQLWHPHGHGNQSRYNISTSFIPTLHGAMIQTWRMLGFRHVALVTVNDTDPDTARAAHAQDGSGHFGMFVRVNGAAVYARGGNKIPMDLLDGRLMADNHLRLVRTAREGNMNMLRVWGGGIWEPRAFFDACDALGVMVYLDMQFSWGSVTVPGGASETVRKELQYQVLRVSHHPSIVIFDGCNECGGGGLYESFVMTTVASVDQSRPIWPSSPSRGWVTGVDRLSSRPNGKPLSIGVSSGQLAGKHSLLAGIGRSSLYTQNFVGAARASAGEQHGPYNGLGWDAGKVGENSSARCDASTIPKSGPQWTGLMYNNVFHSEFGCVAWSSFESISAQLPEDQWSLHSAASHYRNWPVDNVIKSYFGEQQDLNDAGEIAFKRQLYQSMLGQALFLKTEIEEWRSGNIFGSLIWMYNELWPTGGWGSVEYGGGTSGQVPGGRWKPLHYFFKATTFSDQLATCNSDALCYIKNDSPFSFTGNLEASLMNVLTGASAPVMERALALRGGPGVTEWFCMSDRTSEHGEAMQPAPNYTRYADQIPIDAWSGQTIVGQESDCTSYCNVNPPCIGFTTAAGLPFPTACYFYAAATVLQGAPGDAWYQKPETPPLPNYTRYADQIPTDAWSGQTIVGQESDCASYCNVNPPCIGFTTAAGLPFPTACFFYAAATVLQSAPGDAWYQKPEIPPLPGPPPAPTCNAWTALKQWQTIGCDATGSNCLLTLRVGSGSGAAAKTASFNVLPFQPPKAMRLPKAVVTVEVQEQVGDRVPLKLSSTATALYVTLTTKAHGRFSDNALLVKAGSPEITTVDFIPWGTYGQEEHAIFKASLRVEHLVENL